MKLTLVTPGPTAGTRDAVFGPAGDLLDATPVAVRPGTALYFAPEPACRQTAAVPDAEATVLDDLRGPGFGSWQGLSLHQVVECDPVGLQAWLSDPAAVPHGGESLAVHLARVAALLDAVEWPERGAIVVAPALTVRAACIHALAAGERSLLHLDIAPGTTARISRTRGTWRLQSLMPNLR
ncbi:MAG: histidine phosphatase family protein [Propionicimonas sp.]